MYSGISYKANIPVAIGNQMRNVASFVSYAYLLEAFIAHCKARSVLVQQIGSNYG